MSTQLLHTRYPRDLFFGHCGQKREERGKREKDLLRPLENKLLEIENRETGLLVLAKVSRKMPRGKFNAPAIVCKLVFF
jgi:hypothetical protein